MNLHPFKVPIFSTSVLLFSLIVNLLLLAPALHLLQVYDRVLVSQSMDTLIYISLITLAALLFYAIAEVVRTRLAVRIAHNFVARHSESIFHFLVHDRSNALDSNKVLKDLNTVKAFISGRQYLAIHDLPFFPIFLVFLFLLHFTLGIVAALGIAVMAGIALANSLLSKKARQSSSNAGTEASSFSLAVLRRTDDIRAMGLLPSIMQRWGSKTAASLNAADSASKSAAAFYGLGRFVRQSLQVAVMAWGATLVLQNEMSGGMIFAASLLLGKTLAPIEQIIGGWDGIVSYRDSCRSLNSVAAQAAPEERIELPPPAGHLSVENLVFHPGAQTGHKPVIDNVSFKLNPGELVALIGPSGAGKSTISRLIVGATAPTSGTVRLDGFDTMQWPQWQLGQAIGYVPQDIMLFPGTIADNIARLEPEPPDASVVLAARFAGVHDMIAELPDGYLTKVGPGEIPLSGGQRQRIALARAFYSAPRILILDEPNAHLDRTGEERLLKSLAIAKKNGVAVLVISQRQSILRVSDRVLVMVGGRLLDENEAAAMRGQTAQGKRLDSKDRLNTANSRKPDSAVSLNSGEASVTPINPRRRQRGTELADSSVMEREDGFS